MGNGSLVVVSRKLIVPSEIWLSQLGLEWISATICEDPDGMLRDVL